MNQRNLKNLSEEDYDRLPKWENRAMNLTRRYGDVYKVFDYRRHCKYQPWTIAHRLINHNIGKPFAKAFSDYCNKVEFQDQDRFLKEFTPVFRRYHNIHNDYYIDDNGLIQRTESIDNYRGPYHFQSDDYKTELRHKVTGHKMDDFKEVKEKVGFYTTKLLYFEYGAIELNKKPLHLRYKAQKSDFYEIITMGWRQEVASKNDPRYQRHYYEKQDKSKKSAREGSRKKKEIQYNFLTKSELERKQNKSDDLRKIISHGFDPITSFRN